MREVHLFVAEMSRNSKRDIELNIKDEITQDELETLNSAFKISGPYHSITQIKDIVVENGESFKRFMTTSNLEELKKHNISHERAIMLANKAVLNYASSIKTYMDMEMRLLKKKATEKDVKDFQKMQHLYYDKYKEYRFWANFRNYIVHCEFPYSVYKESIEGGCKIICTKEHLLEFDNWKHSKNDICEMPDEVDLPSLIDNMSAMIIAFYMEFFCYFREMIINGINTYGEFCRKYGVKNPVIFKSKSKIDLANSNMQPLPVAELVAAFDILKDNPHVKINIV